MELAEPTRSKEKVWAPEGQDRQEAASPGLFSNHFIWPMSGRQLQEDPLLMRGTQYSGRRGVVGGNRGLVPWLQWKSLEDQVEGGRTE